MVSSSSIMRCPMCLGASHPATGCEYTPTFVVCWRCTLEFWKWCRAHVNGKGRRRGLAFYDHIKSPQIPPKTS